MMVKYRFVLDTQLFGGRGDSSSSGPTKSQYNAAKAKADKIAADEMGKPSGERWGGNSYQQYTDARKQEADIGSKYLLSRVTDSMIEKEMNKYIDEAVKVEGTKATEKWVKTLAATKKDGSPTAKAKESARLDRSDDIAASIGNKLGLSHTHTFMSEKQHNKERDRFADPIMRAARKRIKSGKLK